jgi:HSP20 family molecular chaperone IbpA
VSVHVLPEEIDPVQADVKAVDGLLYVYLPKKNNKG